MSHCFFINHLSLQEPVTSHCFPFLLTYMHAHTRVQKSSLPKMYSYLCQIYFLIAALQVHFYPSSMKSVVLPVLNNLYLHLTNQDMGMMDGYRLITRGQVCWFFNFPLNLSKASRISFPHYSILFLLLF